MPKISAVIPAHDEAATIAGVIQPLLAVPWIDEIIVVNDGSGDDTAARAREMGAKVISIPVSGGQRALRRELWDQVPSTYKKNFQIEIALNFFAKQCGHRMGFTVMPAFGQVIKERKRGLLQGLLQRFSMIGDILIVSWRLYIVLQLQMMCFPILRRSRSHSELESGNALRRL